MFSILEALSVAVEPFSIEAPSDTSGDSETKESKETKGELNDSIVIMSALIQQLAEKDKSTVLEIYGLLTVSLTPDLTAGLSVTTHPTLEEQKAVAEKVKALLFKNCPNLNVIPPHFTDSLATFAYKNGHHQALKELIEQGALLSDEVINEIQGNPDLKTLVEAAGLKHQKTMEEIRVELDSLHEDYFQKTRVKNQAMLEAYKKIKELLEKAMIEFTEQSKSLEKMHGLYVKDMSLALGNPKVCQKTWMLLQEAVKFLTSKCEYLEAFAGILEMPCNRMYLINLGHFSQDIHKGFDAIVFEFEKKVKENLPSSIVLVFSHFIHQNKIFKNLTKSIETVCSHFVGEHYEKYKSLLTQDLKLSLLPENEKIQRYSELANELFEKSMNHFSKLIEFVSSSESFTKHIHEQIDLEQDQNTESASLEAESSDEPLKPSGPVFSMEITNFILDQLFAVVERHAKFTQQILDKRQQILSHPLKAIISQSLDCAIKKQKKPEMSFEERMALDRKKQKEIEQQLRSEANLQGLKAKAIEEQKKEREVKERNERKLKEQEKHELLDKIKQLNKPNKILLYKILTAIDPHETILDETVKSLAQALNLNGSKKTASGFMVLGVNTHRPHDKGLDGHFIRNLKEQILAITSIDSILPLLKEVIKAGKLKKMGGIIKTI